jgi:hypothetical protein
MVGRYVDDVGNPPRPQTKDNWPTAFQGHGHFNAIAGEIDRNYASTHQRWDVWYVDPAHYIEWGDANAVPRSLGVDTTFNS